jgi:hypothetical protein
MVPSVTVLTPDPDAVVCHAARLKFALAEIQSGSGVTLVGAALSRHSVKWAS